MSCTYQDVQTKEREHEVPKDVQEERENTIKHAKHALESGRLGRRHMTIDKQHSFRRTVSSKSGTISQAKGATWVRAARR